ncbi:hypothetical protein K523DRAFT_359173 [Schizophyllum commune Tattone D]|nr:hypothetical protein K523DRAFT_359173 [Schizophyllum commune Tattone D]
MSLTASFIVLIRPSPEADLHVVREGAQGPTVFKVVVVQAKLIGAFTIGRTNVTTQPSP